VGGGCLALILVPIAIVVLMGICSGILSESNDGPADSVASDPGSAPSPPTVIVDLPALAGAEPDSVNSILGNPFDFGPIPEGAMQGLYRPPDMPDSLLSGASIEVAFVNGRADWITIKGQKEMRFSPAVLHQLNLDSASPSFRNEHVIAWTGIKGFREIRVFPDQHGGIDFVYVSVFTSP
jgi:hypothetical protein